MSRKSSDPVAARPVVAIRPPAELRAKLEAAAAASGRSLAHEAEFQLERAFDPIFKVVVKPNSDDKPSTRILRALFTLFEVVSIDKGGISNDLVRAGLSSAFKIFLDENLPGPYGLLSEFMTDHSEETREKLENRLAIIAEQINTVQRTALYGDTPADPGVSLLQSAMLLGLIPSDREEAARSLTAAAEAARLDRDANTEKSHS